MFPKRRLVGICVFAVLALAPIRHGQASPASSRALSAWDQGAIARARKGAAERLRKPECLKLLGDFSDSQGEPLDQNLELLGMDALDYLETIVFKNGQRIEACSRNHVYLVTSPGLRSVFLCPAGGAMAGSRFAQIQMHDPARAEFMVIHEMLHTLGLGENPPTSLEITERVTARCQ